MDVNCDKSASSQVVYALTGEAPESELRRGRPEGERVAFSRSYVHTTASIQRCRGGPIDLWRGLSSLEIFNRLRLSLQKDT